MRQEAEPATTEIEEIADGVLRLQLPLRMPGLGHVNCYAFEDDKGWTIVDPGMPGPQPWKALTDRFTSAGFELRHIHTVVVTHSHIDHFGAAGRVREQSDAKVVTSSTFRTWWDPTDVGEQELEEESQPDPRNPWDRGTPWGGAHPRPPRRVRIRYKVLRPMMRRWFATPSPSVRLEDAEPITFGKREWVSVHTPGHTPDHLCLFDPEGGLLLSGDHVLPTITPHISGIDAGPDPLTDFMASLDKVTELNGVTRVLPAHGHPFDDLKGRVKDIHRHHEERLGRLTEAVDRLGEAPVEELSKHLFRQRSWGPMADSETYAHLEHLRLSGKAERREEEGRMLYSLK